MKIGELRRKYSEFIYKRYSYKLRKGNLEIFFDFEVSPDIKFRSKVVVKGAAAVAQAMASQRGSVLENLIFHLGLAEMPSYWKATASPKIIVEARNLNKIQINWWHDLFLKGMGEFFYKNKIDFTKPNFLQIQAKNDTTTFFAIAKKVNISHQRILVPIGGGKDAIVTYEILKQAGEKLRPFVLNPKKEQLGFLKIVGDNAIVVKRTIDPRLFELNRRGYLNGHTPFSAYLAFLTVLCAALFDYKYIALSNERSSNEGNLKYLGHIINHQYSKSWEFEKKFRAYTKKYLTPNVEYLSFLRPLYELQIAKLFANYPQYFATFLSCNEAHKTNSGKRKPLGPPTSQARALRAGKWCCKCPKCLFVFACLYPFVEGKELIKIFGSNPFEDKILIPLMEELVGERGFKPFECVGTTKENLVAFYLSLQKTHPSLPALLKHFRQHIAMPTGRQAKKYVNVPQIARQTLRDWNTEHALPTHLEKILKSVII